MENTSHLEPSLVAGGRVLRWRKPVPISDSLSTSHLHIKVAAFDLDQTIVDTKSASPFPRDGHDWQFISEGRYKEIWDISQTHQVVIFTNQGGVVADRSRKSYVNLVTKIQGILSKLPSTIILYAATKSADTRFRKPEAGMWFQFVKDLAGQPIDESASFFVGDAAGRRTDHSDADIGFAKNASLKFYTPEQWFKCH